ncbi:predicted protein [Nematostella vectensis]|uniref:P/Homo B domain-containing protein n=1 Tax=Nematostella vectensis TaxID=45351 RepID=A7RME4_NEMVE|nr:predicted protein [Nematostella vectensis]|eukprot:XP_001639389.1 predicted protein [Nematostella vectensis]
MAIWALLGLFVSGIIHEFGFVLASKPLYTNTWVIYTDKGQEYVDNLAAKHGFKSHRDGGGLEGFYILEHQRTSKRMRRSLVHHSTNFLRDPHVSYAKQQKILRRQKRGFVDPLFNDQWYLNNYGQTPGPKGLDINVLPVWRKNITGKNVVVTILDDGIEYTHPDLQQNYDKEASYDYNHYDSDPFPRYSPDNINKHGTRCAGEVAAIKNTHCGVGVAYNARIGGIRMLDGDVTDIVEGKSLSLKTGYIDIYSSSWGPDDDGRTVDGPGPMAKRAFRDGIKKGRRGLGSIFVWATGNGGRYNDYCNCDGYITSIYTISIGAINDKGKSPWYAENCPSTLGVTYSSGQTNGPDLQIVTTDLHHKCTKEHTGTSAAAPLAAGIFALVLEANPKLTWRDLQHLVVNTSKKTDAGDSEWITNGAGHHVNNKYGFGVLDSAALVELAQSPKWRTAEEQHVCREPGSSSSQEIPKNGELTLTLDATGCSGKSNCVTRLEHVRVYVTLRHDRRGAISIVLISPSGTRSDLLKQRSKDFSNNGFKNWPFMTVFSWNENPVGKWKLVVRNHASTAGTFDRWFIKFFGTCQRPRKNITASELAMSSKS